jgi:cysteinyl-tRNA synthetase
MKLFDSLSRSLVAVPTKPVVSWYTCGPTVYDQTHLGHARAYVSIDILIRVVEASGCQVHHVMNVTDVDDKILQRAALLGQNPTGLAREFEREFVRCMGALGVRTPVTMPRVTEHMEEIVKFVEKIVDAGFAHVRPNDGVYFNTAKLGSERYHVLGGRSGEEEGDFVLWKNREKGSEGLGWDSCFGYGRPGWHIECSAMIESVFGSGEKLDIHAGGIDLSFPHHNNEIAQTCARNGCAPNELFGAFVHVGHLNIAGSKMSKVRCWFLVLFFCVFSTIKSR